MDRCLFQLLLLVSFHVLTVVGSPPVLSTTDATENDPLALYCNGAVADAPDFMADAHSMILYRRTHSATDYSVIARLMRSPPAGGNYTFENKPPYANWTYTFEGHGLTTGETIKLMKIRVLINSAQCNDSGSYFCQVFYFSQKGLHSTNSTFQELIVWSPIDNFNLTYQPAPARVNKDDSSHLIYERGTSVNLQCSFQGPIGVALSWQMLIEDGSRGNNPLPQHPYNPDPALHKTPAGCLQNLYMSSLDTEVQAYRATIFKCYVRNERGHVYIKSLKLSSEEAANGEVIVVTTEASSTPNRCSDPAILLIASIVGFLGSASQKR